MFQSVNRRYLHHYSRMFTGIPRINTRNDFIYQKLPNLFNTIKKQNEEISDLIDKLEDKYIDSVDDMQALQEINLYEMLEEKSAPKIFSNLVDYSVFSFFARIKGEFKEGSLERQQTCLRQDKLIKSIGKKRLKEKVLSLFSNPIF